MVKKNKKEKFEWFDLKWGLFTSGFFSGAIYQLFMEWSNQDWITFLVFLLILPFIYLTLRKLYGDLE